ncbi:unnamed protein product [Agarophyton chilense]|eukprot:gb/GEZJ01004400.1/.p1 GENE.gb/GEZJ01004400.1/~~gb/GEZJ01004400.1/.p1  ORF type:complete len:632 (-),score=96.94 gb/GEZJ01004400.1/:525-2387(-)
MSVADRVAALRRLMALHHIHAYIVPTEDAHMSEYVADCDTRRAFISGFDGSAGTVLVTPSNAYCWTDGRYFVQAAKQLPSTVYNLMKMYSDPAIEDWIIANLKPGTNVFLDPTTISLASIKRFNSAITAANLSDPITIHPLPADVPNLVDQVWASARPSKPASTIFTHPLQYAGLSFQNKLHDVRAAMSHNNATALIVTALDDVAWLLNLRASDVEFNPVFWAYVFVTHTNVTLYVNSTRFGKGVLSYLQENDVTLAGYDALLSDLASTKWAHNARMWLDPNTCNYAILHCLEALDNNVDVLQKRSPIVLAKARKCDVELDGMRQSHIRDGAALVKFLCWLEKQVLHLHQQPTECEAADYLQKMRSIQQHFVSLSFPTISSSGANGAVVHYRPYPNSCAKINKDEVYLVDSGGQYLDGTTDVTRTMHFGKASKWQKECFTRVLQGHIAIDRLRFPEGTTGLQIDSFARRSLWEAGLDYAHGTGHGVGSFMNVHEGPHMISFKAQANATALEAGFITSNEPGYYEEGAFGIRIENLCIVRAVDGDGDNGDGVKAGKRFLTMEHITLCPLQREMMEVEMLSEEEVAWIDSYHAECAEKLTPLLGDDGESLAWLKSNTRPLKA